MNPADQAWLEAALGQVGAIAGTVHRRGDGPLRITAAVNIPPKVVERTREIPRGKGMAGLAWKRGAPVSTCDLQADATGDVQPGARAVGAGEATAVPVKDAEGRVEAVVGFAFADPGEIVRDRVRRLEAIASALPGAS